MKRNYVPTTLDSFLSENRNIMLKRKYGEKDPVVIRSNAPLRNRVVDYVNENKAVPKNRLKKYIMGINEGAKNPIASANMWLSRNSKFFITESKNNTTYYKLSPLGKKLLSSLKPNISESEKISRRIEENAPSKKRDKKTYDFVDRTKGEPRPGIYDGDVNESRIPEEQVGDLENYDLREMSNEEHGDLMVNWYELTNKEDGSVIYCAVKPDGTREFYTVHPKEAGEARDIEAREGRVKDREQKEKNVIPKPDDLDERYTAVPIEAPSKDDSLFDSWYRLISDTGEVIYAKVLSPTTPGAQATVIYYSDVPEHLLGPGETSADLDPVGPGMENPSELDDKYEEKGPLDESSKNRLKRIVESMKSKGKIKEEEDEEDEEEEDEDKEKDELSFDDLDIDKEEVPEDEEEEEKEDEEEDVPEDEEEKVEITEFVITVDDVEEAIEELEELEIEAEQVLDEEGEPIEDQIKVSADYWESLRTWLEEKGVDIEEMFGGEIETEEFEEPEGEEFELEDEEKEKDEEEPELDFDLDLDDIDLEKEGEEDVEESITGMETPEKENWPNLVKGRQVTINIGESEKSKKK